MTRGKRYLTTRFGATLEEKGISCKKAAEVAGKSVGMISLYTKGASIPPWPVVKKLADWLEVEPEWLFPTGDTGKGGKL